MNLSCFQIDFRPEEVDSVLLASSNLGGSLGLYMFVLGMSTGSFRYTGQLYILGSMENIDLMAEVCALQSEL